MDDLDDIERAHRDWVADQQVALKYLMHSSRTRPEGWHPRWVPGAYGRSPVAAAVFQAPGAVFLGCMAPEATLVVCSEGHYHAFVRLTRPEEGRMGGLRVALGDNLERAVEAIELMVLTDSINLLTLSVPEAEIEVLT